MDLATTLKLKGYFNGDFDPTVAKARFNEIAQALLERSMAGTSNAPGRRSGRTTTSL